MKKFNNFFKFPTFIAGRYFASKGEPRFSIFLTVISIVGVAVGIAALITVISVMTGFGRELRNKLLGFNPHVTVLSENYIPNDVVDNIKRNFSEIYSIENFVEGEVVAQSETDGEISAIGAKIFGFKDIPRRLKERARLYWGTGRFHSIWWHKYISPLRFGVLLGGEMIYQLGAHPDFGDNVQLIAPFGDIDPVGNIIPSRREYSVIGGFKSGFFEYDTKYIIASFSEVRKLLGTQGRYGLQVMLKDVKKTSEITPALSKFLGESYKVFGWNEKNKRLFGALKLEKIAMISLMFLIVIIASFSIIGVILMIFFSKRKDLAILLSVGSRRSDIKRIFMINGGIIGTIGSVIGVVIGLGACYIIREGNIMLPPSYYLDHLPVVISWPLISVIALGGIFISLASSYYPALRAAATDPIELIRYE